VQTWSAFEGATLAGDLFTFTGQDWAGFSNGTSSLYPMAFPEGGKITFNAALPAGGTPVNVSYKFERLPHPDVDPSFATGSVLIDSEVETTYTIDIPVRPEAETYSSFFICDYL
jgi:hypothetical protein